MDRAELAGTGAALGVPRRADRRAVAQPRPGRPRARAAVDGGRVRRGGRPRPPPRRKPSPSRRRPARRRKSARPSRADAAPPRRSRRRRPTPSPAPRPGRAAASARPAPRRKPPPPGARQARPARLADRRRFPEGHRRRAPSQAPRPPKPAAATFSATARASIGQAIRRQVQPCADRQPYLGEGANRIRVTHQPASLPAAAASSRPPTVVGTSRRSTTITRQLWRAARGPGASHLRRMRAAPPAGRALRDAERRLERLHLDLQGAMRNRCA